MSVPTLAFIKASLKFWHALEKRDQKRLARDKHKIAVRNKQLAQRKLLDANNRPTVMYDSVDVGAIPHDAPAVAGYTTGRFPTFPVLVKQFPKARKLSIAVASIHDADCLDVEPGDSTPELAPGWVKRQQARGVKRPVVYCSVSSARDVLNRLAAAGIPRSAVRLWTAHYTFKAHLCGPQCGFGMTTTADATQWTDKALGRNLDESLVNGGFWA